MATPQNLVMKEKFDENGVPTGGSVRGMGIAIDWQDGPQGRAELKEAQNGAFVEDVLAACLYRLKQFQATRFSCPENVLAASSIEDAIGWLLKRNEDREKRMVDGTHEA
jgi:hypothetical protein